MTTRELLIREINQAPEDVLQETLDYLRQELRRRGQLKSQNIPQIIGPYSEYWIQYIGVFAGEEWDRPDQGSIEDREAW